MRRIVEFLRRVRGAFNCGRGRHEPRPLPSDPNWAICRECTCPMRFDWFSDGYVTSVPVELLEKSEPV